MQIFKERFMWKIFVGFVLFAGLGLFMIFKGGDKVDMSGEKHDTGSHTAAPAAAPATPAAPAAPSVAPASAAK
jgi:drug/metabolite transporter (DMT)-like permease